MLADITRELRECKHELRYLRSETPANEQQGINGIAGTISTAANLYDAKKAYSDFIAKLHAYGVRIEADTDKNTREAGKKWVKEIHAAQELAMLTKWGIFNWQVDFPSVFDKIRYLWRLGATS